MHGFFSSRRNIIACIGGALALAGLTWNLSQRNADEPEAKQSAVEQIREDDAEASPEVYEMSPVAPKPPQAVPEVAVTPPEPPATPEPELEVPEIKAPPEPELAVQPSVLTPDPEPVTEPEPSPTPDPELAAQPPLVTPEPAKILEARALIGPKAVDEKKLLQDLDRTIESGEWNAYREQLKRSIDEAVSEVSGRLSGERLVALNQEPAFYSTLLRWKLLKFFPPGLWTNASEARGFTEFTRHFFGKPAVMEEILMTVKLEDDVLKVLPMMVGLWGSHSAKPELAAKYFNLNLACSVVFDRTVAYVNEDSASGYEEAGGVDASSRYDWYVGQNERGYLEVSIDRSSARDLTFVVCAPVTEAELGWAVKEYRSLRRKSWGKTYGEIEYLMERAVEGLNPYESYTLEEIQKEGGICGDQTHYCVNTARAAGIPAIGLSGTTDSGPHAWAAVKIEDDEWSTEIGRIKGVSQGRASDPQTGKTINEQDIWMWSSREYRRASRKLELQRQLWLAQLFGVLDRPEWQRMVVEEARRDGEPYPEFWEVLCDSMKNDPELADKPKEAKTLERWQDFCDDLKREFKENPRMSGLTVEVEEEHLFPHMELGDIRRQLDRDRRRQQREAPEQVDLITTSLKREANWIQTKLIERAEKDEDAQEEARQEALREISQLYDKSLREYGKSVSGFGTMSEDYFAFVKDDEELAPKAVRDIELAFKRVVDTGSDDWFRAKTEVGLHRRICEMYRHVGEDKRADVMERRLERQMERARRGAL